MHTISDLLDAIKQTRNIETDSALASALGVSRQTVNNWRQGRNTPDAVACATIAGLSGQPLNVVIGIAGEQRAVSREEKAVWRKLASSAMLFCLATGLVSHAFAMDPLKRTAEVTQTTEPDNFGRLSLIGSIEKTKNGRIPRPSILHLLLRWLFCWKNRSHFMA